MSGPAGGSKIPEAWLVGGIQHDDDWMLMLGGALDIEPPPTLVVIDPTGMPSTPASMKHIVGGDSMIRIVDLRVHRGADVHLSDVLGHSRDATGTHFQTVDGKRRSGEVG